MHLYCIDSNDIRSGSPVIHIHLFIFILTDYEHDARLVATVAWLELHGSRPTLHQVYPQLINRRKRLLKHFNQEGQQNIEDTEVQHRQGRVASVVYQGQTLQKVQLQSQPVLPVSEKGWSQGLHLGEQVQVGRGE